MRPCVRRTKLFCLLLAFALVAAGLAACSSSGKQDSPKNSDTASEREIDTSNFIVAIEDEPDTVDFQCTTINYTIAINAFNRLVETELDARGNASVVPSLAESWEVSDDGRTYTFHLRDGVTFSNGSPLTSDDVLYTFTRLLTHPASCNRDIAEPILGAKRLEKGETSQLEGIEVLSDLDFAITLEQPFEAFLACLSMPGASIMDKETMETVGDWFGKQPDCTVGTGSFILKEWTPGKGMILVANENCWEGPPHSEGLDLRFLEDPEEVRTMFEKGELDILDLDEVGNSAEFFIHGDIYQDRLHEVQRVGTVYIALNESIAPLNDVRVRKALQLALDRRTLLIAVYDGFGSVEHGMFPHGLYGFNPDLPQIPYAPDEAKALLQEAGYPDGFNLAVGVKSSSTRWEMDLMRMAASMWEDIGVHATITLMDESEFMELRKSGNLACYTAMWTADYDDPDTFAYTFFGNVENTTFRSLCYQREDIMERVRLARVIPDSDKRIKEYQDLERIIIQDDAAWIPLFSRLYTYVTSERLKGFQAAWNGSVKAKYREMTVSETPKWREHQ